MQKGFKYCNTTAFQIFSGSPLAGLETSWRVRKSPDFYGANNLNAHQPAENFEMLMAWARMVSSRKKMISKLTFSCE